MIISYRPNTYSYIPSILGILSLIFLTSRSLILWIDLSIIFEWSLLAINSTPLKITLFLDKTGLLYSSIVLFISANVLSFSKLYIQEDPFINRFTILVLLFVASINLLIFIPHFIALLLG
jgi:NADH:ubiquinone oxidoreductase subunit 5 (subunit L)/multisubunit Na+/H+ antiporter MnhA subunit